VGGVGGRGGGGGVGVAGRWWGGGGGGGWVGGGGGGGLGRGRWVLALCGNRTSFSYNKKISGGNYWRRGIKNNDYSS